MRASVPRFASVVAVAAAALPAGCDPYRCLVQSRARQYEAAIASGPVAGRASFELAETRGAESGQFVIWHVRVGPLGRTAWTDWQDVCTFGRSAARRVAIRNAGRRRAYAEDLR